MRIERVGLEHHGDVAVARRQIVHPHVADADLASAEILQSGDDAQQRRLAATRRPDEDDEFTRLDRQVYPLEDWDRAIVLAHAVDSDRCHLPNTLSFQPFTAPAVSPCTR